MTNISLEQAIAALRAQDRQTAGDILAQLREQQPERSDTWLWSAAASTTTTEKQAFLERVLTIEPHNQKAQAGLKALGASSVAETPTMLMPSANTTAPAKPLVTPVASGNSLAAPRFAPTGVRSQRAVPWTLIALVVALVLLIPIAILFV